MITKVLDNQGNFTGVTAKVTNLLEAVVVLRQTELTKETYTVGKVGKDGLQVFDRLGKLAFTFKKVG